MSKTADRTKTAYGDESIRMAGTPPFYMMGVALIPDSTQIGPELFGRILPKGSKKLHWRDMNEGLQRKSLRLLSGMERADLVVIASPLAGRKQERARRKCLEALLPSLEGRGVDRLVLESRKPTADKLDIDFVKYAKGSKIIKSIEVVHESGEDEPRLWIADQVLGAMGDYLTRTGGWEYWKDDWEAIGDSIERIDVSI
ncbi:MAG: hypothetical protein IJ087_06400 [Eggerthellaceae bacterium]|nr:hypothetical protein [Eggerthellaceae bacterium]